MYKLRTRACTDWNQLIASIPANLLDSTVAYAENCGPNRLAGIEVSFGTEPKPPQKQGLRRPVVFVHYGALARCGCCGPVGSAWSGQAPRSVRQFGADGNPPPVETGGHMPLPAEARMR